jgi:hypothetical protein
MSTDFFSEWRAADRAAAAAEKLVFQDSMSAIEDDSAAPTAAAQAEALRLRAIADDLFAVAMMTFKEKAAKFRRY